MNFSGLAENQRVTIIMELRRAAEFVTKMNQSAMATARMAAEERRLARATKEANAMSFIQRQGMYTLRRYTFYATLAVTALAFSVAKLGLSYYNTTQTAMVGFTLMLHSQKAARRELDLLYAQAATSPFQFTDIVNAARLIQPYAHNLAVTNRTVRDLSNTLSSAGQLTGNAMQRASLQMSHMFTIGRLTGQILLALGRDFVPMNLALQSYLHLSGEMVRARVAAGLIDAATAAKALHYYIMADPGRANAALVQSTQTLVGAWSTLKDLLGMSAASAGGGIFDAIRLKIRAIDRQLLLLTNSGRHLTMMDFMNAVDREMSPHTHAIINSFILLTTTIKTIAAEFYILYRAIGYLFRPLDALGNLFGQNHFAMKALGIIMGTWITLLIVARTRVMLLAEAEVFGTLVTVSWGKGLLFINGALRIMNLLIAGQLLASLRKWAFMEKSLGRVGVFVNNGKFAVFTRYLFGLAGEMSMASVLMFGIVGIAILLVATIVILYFKWKRFHDLVNNSFHWFTSQSPIVQIALAAMFGPIIEAAAALRYILANIGRLGAVPHALFPPESQAHEQSRKSHGFGWNFLHGAWDKIPHPGADAIGNVVGVSRVRPVDNSAIHGSIVVHVYPQHIYMDGKKVGEALATTTTDKEARL